MFKDEKTRTYAMLRRLAMCFIASHWSRSGLDRVNITFARA